MNCAPIKAKEVGFAGITIDPQNADDPGMKIILSLASEVDARLTYQRETDERLKNLETSQTETKQLAIEAKAISAEAKQISEDIAKKQEHDANDLFSFAIPWLKTYGIKVPTNYHSQIYKECKALARGYNPELFRKPFNGFPTMRFDERTMFAWVTRNRTRTDRAKWFLDFKAELFEECHARLNAQWAIKVTKSAVEWVTDRFRERNVWNLETLLMMGRSVGLGHEALHSPEVLSLPIRRTVQINGNGHEEWSWRACRNWPA